jgi:molecular chaperone DnaK
MGISVGIDLGTTFSAIAVVDESGRPAIVNNSEDNPVTPSVICFNGGEPVVGEEAKEMQALGESNIASFFKRSMGNERFVLEFNGREYSPTELSAIMLKKLKADAEAQLGKTVENAVITVPAYFNNHQRKATIEAGETAGLKVLRIINEPTSAALAYGLNGSSGEQAVLVYDLGGGTFDVSIVQISEAVIQVLATGGDHELGGKDWDDRIAAYIGNQFQQEYGMDPLNDAESFQDLLVRTENAKKQLSLRDKVRVSIVHDGEKGTYELTRSRFEEITEDLMERTRALTRQILEESGKTWEDIQGVLLVGGSTRMPMVREFVKAMSGKDPLTGVNVDEAVALGAAIQAHLDSADNSEEKTDQRYALAGSRETRDVISHSMGMAAVNEDRSKYINSIIIPKNNRIPCTENRPYQLRTGKDRDNKVEVYMLQGESDAPLDCTLLGKYVFSEIRHDPKNPLAILDIEYRYDRNGVVLAAAVQRETKERLPLTIEPLPADLSWLSQPPPAEEEIIYNHISIFLVLDVSFSMVGEPLREAKKAAKEFVKACDLAHMSVGVIQFGSTAAIMIPPSQNAKKINTAINRLRTNGSTNMTDGIRKAQSKLRKVDSLRYIVLLTDGMPDNKISADRAARATRNDGIEIICIGTGGADRYYLKRIASSDADCLFAQAGGVVATFSTIAQQLTESGGKR